MAKEYMQLEEKLQKKMFSRRDFALISAMFRESISKEEAVYLTEGINMDTESSLYMLSLSIVGFRSGWDIFPDRMIPRLKGLHRYYQVSSLAGMPWLDKKLETLFEAGIPCILTGGTAIRAYYASDVPRLMYGYDITVHTDDYEKTVSLLRDEVRKKSSGTHERTVDGYTKIMLHKGVPVAGLFAEDAFWEQACTIGGLNKNVLVPGPEDMLIQLFCLPFGTQLIPERNEERDRRLYDAGFVLKKRPVDYKILADKARAYGLESQIRFFMEIISESAPEVFPKDRWEVFFPLDKEYISFLKNMLKYEEIVRKSKKKTKASYWLSLRRIRMDHKIVLPLRKACGKKTGVVAYIMETRNISCFSDLFRRRKQERIRNHEQQ